VGVVASGVPTGNPYELQNAECVWVDGRGLIVSEPGSTDSGILSQEEASESLRSFLSQSDETTGARSSVVQYFIFFKDRGDLGLPWTRRQL